MPQAEMAAAPAPVTPRTFRKRLRSIVFGPSVIAVRLVVTHGTVAADFVLLVAGHAPPHSQRRDLVDLWHRLHIAMARAARLRAEGLDVALVRETHEARQRVNARPLRGFSLTPRVAHLLDLGLMRRRRAGDQLVAAEAGLQRGDPGFARHCHRRVAVHARDLVLPRVNVVSEENRLAGTLEVPRIADDRRL